MWLGFAVLVAVVLFIDLGVANRKSHEVTFREALSWSGVWITLAMAFNGWIWYARGTTTALEFLTGYVIEYALSVDNIFIFLVIFQGFAVPRQYRHSVLFWGVLGAVVLRAVMVFAGSALLTQFHWLIYIFGGFLILTGGKMLIGSETESDPTHSWLYRTFRKLIPTSKNYDGEKFLTIENGKRVATPLLLVLLLVEFTDVVFALDSIPAIFAVTRDPFVVLTSNIFAILGLRSMFFVLEGFASRFAYLKVGLALTLCFVGTKMLIAEWYKIPVLASLGVVATLIGGSALYSVWRTRADAAALGADRVG